MKKKVISGSMAIFLMIFILILRTKSTSIPALCAKPQNRAPQLSFSLMGFRTGDFRNQCHLQIQKAIDLSLTAVTLVPARIYDGGKVISEGTVTSDEITNCLSEIWDSGLDLIYQPHLESDYLIHPEHARVWRAQFDFSPGEDYEKFLFEPFFNWAQTHSTEIRKGNRHIDITVAAELETSLAHYPDKWLGIASRFRQKLSQMGLRDKVHLGYNPNWWPVNSHYLKSEQLCRDFGSFTASLDFIAPSAYGDWSQMYLPGTQTPRGLTQMEVKKVEILDRLRNPPGSDCAVPQVDSLVFSLGEFAVGLDFTDVSKFNEVSDTNSKTFSEEYILKRRAIYSNIIEWAKSQTSPHRLKEFSTINFWTQGVFDPIGINANKDTVIDPEIADLIKTYSKWRCKGGLPNDPL